jgi:hypothetical protein
MSDAGTVVEWIPMAGSPVTLFCDLVSSTASNGRLVPLACTT